jgi:hypothetical protein
MAYTMSNNISESAVTLHRLQPFQVRKVRKRSFFSRVFGGSRPTDAEAAIENLIAERGLDNVDVVAIDNCLHQYGVRDEAVRPFLLQVWRHAVERFVRIDGTLDNLEAAFLDQLKELFGLGEVEANNERYSVLTAEFMDRARALISRLDAQSLETRSRISRVARQLWISPDKQKSLLKNLAQASFDSILKYWIGKGRIDATTANALLAFKDEYGLSLADTEQNELERCWYQALLDKGILPKEDVDLLLNADETCHFALYSVLLAQTEAFLRYLGQEGDDLAGPIAASYPGLGLRDTAAGRQIIHTTFVSVVAYLSRMGGPITEPTLAFWKCIENFLAIGCGAAPSSIEKIREFFNRVTEAKTPLALNDLALSDLRLLPALQQYDAEHGTKLAERARMLIWRFAASFVGVDGESTPDEESALDEFRQALDGRTAWTLLNVQPDTLAA